MSYKPTRYLLLAIVSLWVGMAGIAQAVTINASATISTATLTINAVTDLDFGTIVVTGISEILIDASAAVAPVASTVNLGTASITVAGTSGLVQVTSPVDATVDITYSVVGDSGGTDVLDDSAGTPNTMGFTAANMRAYSTGGGTIPGTLALTANTPADVHVGGLLQIGASQTPGTYGGVITVNVVY